MTTTSRAVGNETITAAQYNSLRSDVLENHIHDNTDGAKVHHDNLLHTPGGATPFSTTTRI